MKFINYLISGSFVNLTGYSLYLIITYIGLPPKLTILLLTPYSILLSFFINDQFIFKNKKKHLRKKFSLFIVNILIGNIFYLFLIYFFCDLLGYDHRLIYLIGISIYVVISFLFQKFIIFN